MASSRCMLNSFLSVRIFDLLFLFPHCYHEKLMNIIMRQVGRMFHIYFPLYRIVYRHLRKHYSELSEKTELSEILLQDLQLFR